MTMTDPKQPKIDVQDYIDKRNQVIEDLKTMPEIKNMSWQEYKAWKALKQQQNDNS